MMIVDAHTHFKEKFWKVLSARERQIYFKSGVKVMIGVTDFFPVPWPSAVRTWTKMLAAYLGEAVSPALEPEVIENILWEEVDWNGMQWNMGRLVRKLERKCRSHAGVNVQPLEPFLAAILPSVLPSEPVSRYLKNIEAEIASAGAIEAEFGVRALLCTGIHPLAIGQIGDWPDIERVLARLEMLLTHCPRVVGLGECGIENNTPMERKVLLHIFRLGRKLDVPFVVHTPLTLGQIPAPRKVAGIKTVCKLAKAAGVAPHRIAFDHITDMECVKAIESAFREERPYISISMQDHWLSPEAAADLIKHMGPEWKTRVMLNSDFGTYQTPDAFSRVKRALRKQSDGQEMVDKALSANAMRFFELERRLKRLDAYIAHPKALDLDGLRRPEQLLIALDKVLPWMDHRARGTLRIRRFRTLAQRYLASNDARSSLAGSGSGRRFIPVKENTDWTLLIGGDKELKS